MTHRHPLTLISAIGAALAEADLGSAPTAEQASDYRMQTRRVLQAMARAGVTEVEACVLARHYSSTDENLTVVDC